MISVRSITFKLVLGFLFVGLVSILIVAALARRNTSSEFQRFVSNGNQNDYVGQLTEYYRVNQSWAGLEQVFPANNIGATPEVSPSPVPPFILADPSGKVILNRDRFRSDTQISPSELSAGTPIEVDGKIAGYLIIGRSLFEGNPRAQEFIERTNSLLLYSALAAIAIALLLGIMLSRTLTRPLVDLTRATHAIAQGDYAQRVAIRSRDELGELAEAFNKMSAELSRSLSARKQMTADIAHELRTPLSLILGHAEAVQDGVLPPTPENFAIIHEEAIKLEKLVEDLRTLSLADAGALSIDLQTISAERLLEEVIAHYGLESKTKELTLDLDVDSALPNLNIDPGRMTQVLMNLLDNAVRHTPVGGHILLAAHRAPNGVELNVHDGGPGLPAADLERIFDRFYRTDSPRDRSSGGSGLGLAIAKSIVQAHGGQIRAESAADSGLTIIITLPNEPTNE